jgi:hypothetical protein
MNKWLCKLFEKGDCKFGDACRYSHGQEIIANKHINAGKTHDNYEK